MTERRVLLDLRNDTLFPLLDDKSQSTYVSDKLTDIIIEDGKTRDTWEWGDKLIVKCFLPEVPHPVQVTVDFEKGNTKFYREVLMDEDA